MTIVATTEATATLRKTARSICLLKVPLELRPILSAFFAGDDLSYPSIRQPDGSFTNTIPAPLLKRLLADRPAFLAVWHDLHVPEDEAAALQAQGVHLFRLDHARLLGPVPETAYQPRSYGLRLIGAPSEMTGGPVAEAEAAVLLARYREQRLTAVTEPGGAVLPVQAKQLLKAPSIMVIAEDDHGQPTTLADLKAWLALLQRARTENPGQTVTFLTNGRMPPQPTDPAQAAVLANMQELADIICSERWNTAFVPKCRAVYTRGATAAFDALLADLRCVVTEPGPLQDMAQGKRNAPDAFADLFLTETLFGDPVHGRVLERALVCDVIAARRDLLPAAPLPAALRWPHATGASDTDARPLPGFAGHTASYKAIDSSKVIELPQSLIAPAWLAPHLVHPAGEMGPVIMLQGDKQNIAQLDNARALCTELSLQTIHDEAQVEEFARYQPALFLKVLRANLRKAGLRKALICDISSTAVRLFARACAMEGIERAYLPPRLAPPAAIASLRALADVAFVWHPEQSKAILTDGKFEPDRLSEVRLELPQDDRDGLVIWLNKTGLSLSRLKAVISEALAVADLMDREILFALGPEALGKLDSATFERVAFHPLARYVVLGPHVAVPADVLSQAAFVVTSDAQVAALADQLACQSAPLTPETEHANELPADDLRKHVRAVLLAWFDTAFGAPARPQPSFSHAPDLLGVLQAWADAAPVPRDRVFRPENIDWAIGTVSESTLRHQSRYMIPALGVGRYSEVKFENAPHDFPDADVLFQWGLRVTKHKARADETARALNLPVVNLEDGFIRSIGIGLSGETSVSVCFDDQTAFYDATKPSQLELWINRGVPLTQAEHTRARAVIDRIVAQKITKYNFAPYVPIVRPDQTRKAILVVDQRAGDVSIEKGLASPETFVQMVDAALSFADTHDILIKTHPDANIGGKDSAIGGATLSRAAQHPAVTLVTEDMHPYSLIDNVEKVFVVSSGMGFEALLAGREVWCFGAPFYAGWGLTRDHVALARRTARPTLEAVFHAFYIEHTRYYDPIADKPGQIEAAIDYILLQRPWSLERCQNAAPRVLRQQPVRDARTAALKEAFDKMYCLGFPERLEAWLDAHFPGSPRAANFDEAVIVELGQAQRPALLVHEGTPQPGMQALAARRNIPVIHARKGLVAWAQAHGPELLPYALSLDAKGVPACDIEHLLLTHDFSSDPALLARAAALRPRVAALGLADGYKLPRHPAPYGPKTGRRVLVLGVERQGTPAAQAAPDANIVAQVKSEDPMAQIVYHCINAHAQDLSKIQPTAQICTLALCPDDLFDGVDHVYTSERDDGFVALLRGLPVTTFGQPIYAGWGLTDDRAKLPERGRVLNLDALVAGLLLLHPAYIEPGTSTALTAEDVLDRLERSRSVAQLAAL